MSHSDRHPCFLLFTARNDSSRFLFSRFYSDFKTVNGAHDFGM